MLKVKRLISIFLTLVLLFGVITITPIATVSAVTFMPGDGTSENPYIISTIEQLELIRDNPSSCYILDKDIDLSSIDNWIPISPFFGTFDGNGHVISNIKIDVCYYDDNMSGLSADSGFFGYTNGAHIVNLCIENADYSVSTTDFNSQHFSNVGGIAGTIENTVIESSYFKGSIRNAVGGNVFSRVSGIAAIGINSMIDNCYSTADIFGEAPSMNVMASGLVAWMDHTTVKNSYVSGSLLGKSVGYCYVGGVNASMAGGAKVINCVILLESISAEANQTYVDNIGNFSEKTNCIVLNYDSPEAKIESTYTNLGWDFTDTWDFVSQLNFGYPCLKTKKIEFLNMERYLVDEVKKYTSESTLTACNKILESEESLEVKFKKLNEFFNHNGLTDLRNGISYMSNAQTYWADYTYLTTNEIYCSYNFYDWLYHTKKGQETRALLITNSLIFNDEFNDYLTGDYPGIKKSKKLLQEFMAAYHYDNENLDKINTVYDIVQSTLEFNDIEINDKVEELLEQIVNCHSEKDRNKLQSKLWNDFLIPIVNNKEEFKFYGQAFSEAMDMEGYILSFTGVAAEDINELVNLESNIRLYKQYDDFLQNIYNSSEISWEMKTAAKKLHEEIYSGWYKHILDFVVDISEVGVEFINEKILHFNIADWEWMFGKTVGGTIESALSTFSLAAQITNSLIDVGDFSDSIFEVVGYAELSALYSQKLKEDYLNFKRAPFYENASIFCNDYNILLNLRCQSEQKYLDSNTVQLLFNAQLRPIDYAFREEMVKGTLNHLATCKFGSRINETSAEAVRFERKAVINCPVDVDVYTRDGQLVASLKDGQKSDITNEFGRFAVVYNPYDEEYSKVICQTNDEDLIYKITAVADGLVDYAMCSQDEPDIINSFDNVKVEANDVIYINNITENATYSIDRNNDGVAECTENFTIIDQNDYLLVESLGSVKNEYTIKESCTIKVDTRKNE